VSRHRQLAQVGLGEAAELLQGVVLRHGQAADVGGEEAKGDALQVRRGVGDGVRGVLQAEDGPQEVGDALGHICKEEEEEERRCALPSALRRGSEGVSAWELEQRCRGECGGVGGTKPSGDPAFSPPQREPPPPA